MNTSDRSTELYMMSILRETALISCDVSIFVTSNDTIHKSFVKIATKRLDIESTSIRQIVEEKSHHLLEKDRFEITYDKASLIETGMIESEVVS